MHDFQNKVVFQNLNTRYFHLDPPKLVFRCIETQKSPSRNPGISHGPERVRHLVFITCKAVTGHSVRNEIWHSVFLCVEATK